MTTRIGGIIRLFILGSAFTTLHARVYADTTTVCPDMQRAYYTRNDRLKTEYWLVPSPQIKKSKGVIYIAKTINNLHSKYVKENRPTFVCQFPNGYENCLSGDGRSFKFSWNTIPNKSGGFTDVRIRQPSQPPDAPLGNLGRAVSCKGSFEWEYTTYVIQESFDSSNYLPYLVLERTVYPISVTEAGRVPEF